MTIIHEHRTFDLFEVKKIVDYLRYLGEVYAATDVPNRHWKSVAMYKAANTVASAQRDIVDKRLTLAQFSGFKNVGNAIIEAIDELIELEFYFDTGKVKKLSMSMTDNKVLRSQLIPVVTGIINKIQEFNTTEDTKIVPAGSFRRKSIACGDLDFVTTIDARIIHAAMEELGATYKYGGQLRLRFEYLGIGIDFRCTKDEYFYSHLLHYTGPAALNIQMRQRAAGLNMKLSEYGLEKDGERLLDGSASESEYFKFLQLEDPRNLVKN